MEILKFKKFTQQLAELKKSEIKKVDDFFNPQLEAASNAFNAKFTLWDIAKERAQREKRTLSQEELKLEKEYIEAKKIYQETREKWLSARFSAGNHAEKLTFDIFTKDTETIIDLLKNDIPIQIAILALNVYNLPHRLKDNDKVPKELREGTSIFFTDKAIKERLQEIYTPFLDLLKEKDKQGYENAWQLINECIQNKNTIVLTARKQLMQVFEDTPIDDKFEFQNQDIIKATTTKAKEIASGTTKLETKVFSPKDNPAFYGDSSEIQMWVGNNKKKELLTIVSIDFNEMKKKGVLIPSEKWLTHFDREILCAAVSLYEAKNVYITPKMIYQALSGNNKDVKMTPAMRDEIIKSIDKLMGTIIEINASEEVKAGWRQEAEYKGALLPCKRVSKKDIRINGQEVIDCIQLLGSSPLYDYAKGINQISRASIDMLNAPVNNTPENITLKGYLLRTITSMKSPKSKLKPVIRYDTIYEYLGIENTDKMAKKRVRDRTKEILNFWVNEGLITGFDEEKEGKTFEKIKIEL